MILPFLLSFCVLHECFIVRVMAKSEADYSPRWKLPTHQVKISKSRRHKRKLEPELSETEPKFSRTFSGADDESAPTKNPFAVATTQAKGSSAQPQVKTRIEYGSIMVWFVIV